MAETWIFKPSLDKFRSFHFGQFGQINLYWPKNVKFGHKNGWNLDFKAIMDQLDCLPVFSSFQLKG